MINFTLAAGVRSNGTTRHSTARHVARLLSPAPRTGTVASRGCLPRSQPLNWPGKKLRGRFFAAMPLIPWHAAPVGDALDVGAEGRRQVFAIGDGDVVRCVPVVKIATSAQRIRVLKQCRHEYSVLSMPSPLIHRLIRWRALAEISSQHTIASSIVGEGFWQYVESLPPASLLFPMVGSAEQTGLCGGS